MGGKGKGSVAVPASPPGANTETRDGKGGRRVSTEGKVKTMKEGIDIRSKKLGVLFNSDPP